VCARCCAASYRSIMNFEQTRQGQKICVCVRAYVREKGCVCARSFATSRSINCVFLKHAARPEDMCVCV